MDNVSYLRGKHAFRFGFEYLDIVFDGDTISPSPGLVKFTPLENFLQGAPSSGPFIGDPTQNTRAHWFGGFFQDDWRVSPG